MNSEISRGMASAELASSQKIVIRHSPGPWHAGEIESLCPIVRDDKADICLVNYRAPDDAAVPNARLIAAAPDMLAKLEELYEWLDGIGDGAPDASPTSRRALNHASEIDDIIRKATVSA
jgi:hypothetical protein